MENYRKDYPRPQLIRDSWENLNGSWAFAFDDSRTGIENGWTLALPKGAAITVPFTYETKASGLGDESFHPCVWYQRNVAISDGQRGGKVLLHFEGSDYITDVWLNGAHVGSHTGGYARFSFDVTACAKTGANNLTVRVQDSMDMSQPRGKQRWIKNNFGCWYVQTTGIWKTVWLEYVPGEYIKSVKLTPDFAGATMLAEVEAVTGNAGSGGKYFSVEAEVTFDGKFVTKASFALAGGKGMAVLNIFNQDIHEWGLREWSPEHPNLYDIKFILKKDEHPVDTVLSYFGMRDIKIHGNQVLLNKRKLYQRLILDQGYWQDSHLTPPNEEALIEDIDKIIALGYNGVRKHQKTEDERFLYWCDVKGLLVWSEMAAAYSFNDNAVEDFTNQWMEIVRQNYNHPCIITWTPFNESWGLRSVFSSRRVQHFTEAIYHLTKSFDPNRPVIVNDGWEHTVSDIITLHDYRESGEELYRKYSRYDDLILGNHDTEPNSIFAFAEGFKYKGQPVIISEFGGIAFKDEAGWGYGNQVATEEAFLARFDSITSAIKKLPYVCGFCYTQVTDVQQEVNGLMDVNRRFKIDPEKIKEINLRR